MIERLRAALPLPAKRLAWELKYRFFRYPMWTSPDDVVAHILAESPNCGCILELGCGRGSLVTGLRAAGWGGRYCGVDISDRAISEARAAHDDRCSWVCSDIESFTSSEKWDVILMVESVYYLKCTTLPFILRRICKMLDDSAVLIIRIHDPAKHSPHVEAILSLKCVVDRIGNHLFCIRPPLSLG